jgi:hypothetical protein
MKKWLFGLLAVLVLLMISIYVFIPGQIRISDNVLTGCDNKNVSVFLHDQEKWMRWWPKQAATITSTDSFVNYNDGRYKLTKPLADGGEIQLIRQSDKFETIVFVLPVNKDSTAVVWQTSFPASLNPVKRIALYMEALKIKKDMKAILESLRLFVDKTENIYGINVKREKVKIDFMISTKKAFSHSPTTEEIYEMIASVKKYIASLGANETDHPMLSIMAQDSLQYEVYVAIPVDKKLPGNDSFSFKWMPKGGNILVAEIQGGTKTTQQALIQFKAYVTDHQFTEIAIPFQSLVTDRMKEADSSKWITRLYYPVM